MKELAKGTIGEMLAGRDTPCPNGWAVAEVSALPKILAMLQSISVVHQDLTPHNVLLALNGKLKPEGFGIAKMLL